MIANRIALSTSFVYNIYMSSWSTFNIKKPDTAQLRESEKRVGVYDRMKMLSGIRDAKKNGIMVSMPIEKSGQDEFDFEFADFKAHIKRANPDFVKVLVRFNPEGDKSLNKRQLEKLKKASDHIKEINKKMIFELLVPATRPMANTNP